MTRRCRGHTATTAVLNVKNKSTYRFYFIYVCKVFDKAGLAGSGGGKERRQAAAAREEQWQGSSGSKQQQLSNFGAQSTHFYASWQWRVIYSVGASSGGATKQPAVATQRQCT